MGPDLKRRLLQLHRDLACTRWPVSAPGPPGQPVDRGTRPRATYNANPTEQADSDVRLNAVSQAVRGAIRRTDRAHSAGTPSLLVDAALSRTPVPHKVGSLVASPAPLLPALVNVGVCQAIASTTRHVSAFRHASRSGLEPSSVSLIVRPFP